MADCCLQNLLYERNICMKINLKFIFDFLVLLATEIFIGIYVKDAIIRPYIGDISAILGV
jgi:hypothetical protein